MLGLRAAGIGFLAVAVTEPGVDPQGDARAWNGASELLDHVRGTAVDVQS